MIHIETNRLILRNFQTSDAGALREMILQYAQSPYAKYDHPWPTGEAEIRGVTEWFAGGDQFLAVCQKETGQLIGLVALSKSEEEARKAYDLGYVFNFDYHGQGFASEAAGAVVDFAFTQLAAETLTSGTAAENEPSCRLLMRLGFQKVGEGEGAFQKTADGQPITFTGYAFALSRAAWIEARRSQG